MCYKKTQSFRNEIIYKFEKIEISFLRIKIQFYRNEITHQSYKIEISFR